MPQTEGEQLPALILRREELREQLLQIRTDAAEKVKIYREEISHVEEQILNSARHAAQLVLPLSG